MSNKYDIIKIKGECKYAIYESRYESCTPSNREWRIIFMSLVVNYENIQTIPTTVYGNNTPRICKQTCRVIEREFRLVY